MSRFFGRDFAVVVSLLVGAIAFWYLRLILPATVMHAGGGDFYTQIYPMAYRAAKWMWDGHLPLWNPYQLCGHPFLASVLYGVFYPLNFPNLLFPTEIALEVIAALHLFLAGLFTYFYARVIGLSRIAALVAGAIFMLSGFVTSQALWFTPAIGAIVWLPVGFLAVEKLFQQRTFRWAIVLATAVAMPVLAGWLQTWTYSMHAIGAYSAVRLLGVAARKDERQLLPRLTALVAAGFALGIALAAVQLLPSLELQKLGPRRPGGLTLEQSLSMGPVAPKKLLDDTLESRPGFPRPSYVGIVALLLSPLSLFAKRGRFRIAFFWCLATWGILVSLSVYTPVFQLFRMLPGGAWFRVPARIVFLFVFASAVLSGVGLDVLFERRPAEGRTLLPAVVVTVAGLAALIGIDMPGLSQAYLAAGIALLWVSVLVPRRFVYAPLGLLFALLVWDLFYATESPALHPYHDLTVYNQEAGAFEFVKGQQGLYRTYIHWSWPGNPALMPKQGTLREIFTITDYEPLSLEREAKYYAQLDARHYSDTDVNRPPFIGYLELDPGPVQLRLLDLMSVRYIIDHPMAAEYHRKLMTGGGQWRGVFIPRGGHEAVFENAAALPRAYVAHDWKVADAPEDALAQLMAPAFNPRQTVVLEQGEGTVTTPAALPSPITDARITEYTPTTVMIAVNAAQPGYLVLTDTFYPGWKAFVDGREEKVYRANYLFRAVPVGSGEHTVTFVFRSLSFEVGAAITLLSVALIGIYAGVQLRRTRHERTVGPRDHPPV